MAVVPFPDPQGSKDSSARDESGRWHTDEGEETGGKMSFLEHLDELRKRLIYSLISLAVGVGIACLFIERIYQFVMRPTNTEARQITVKHNRCTARVVSRGQ